MNVKDIVKEYLAANGYDGLYNINGECGCELGDLGPCCDGVQDICKPGFKRPMTEEERQEYDVPTWVDGDWMIGAEKPRGGKE